MRQLGLVNALRITHKARKLDRDQLLYLQQQRLTRLVQHAKQHSPYFSERFKPISGPFEITDLPVTHKTELMEHFNDWLTDRSVSKQQVERFMETPENIGRKLNGRYLVHTTSGSTGHPAIILYDKTTMNVVSAIALLRGVAKREDFQAFLKSGKRTAGLFVDGGFYLGNGTVRYNQRRMPWKKNQVIIDVRQDTEDIVRQLNAFQPALLGGYPTALELLLPEQQNGNLTIAPVLIMAGGEHLSAELRTQLREAFGCTIQSTYACTEAGTIACECREGRYHIHEDCLIVEAVDRNFRPVADGEPADQLLITNLFNYSQPFIRYVLTDRATIHDEPCPCGKASRWIEPEGRTDDILCFSGGRKVTPLAVQSIISKVEGIERFQLIQQNETTLELRLQAPFPEDAFQTAEHSLQSFFRGHGIEAQIYLSDKAPQVHPKSGKFKHIYTSPTQLPLE
ncbi:phenylacetate--CoA ligase family protein [Planococcus sp. CPCC 101016]|uniref:phenylacetate--CoA ligase family protein n=1 Tax=Planococcus sp. CPCC 101016 TaxID=2599617 RepID=UPI0011B84C2C|nr:AMP-binding protein [Planococcus sp. CPCC 101016]TWT07951.1 phenylacetate--CoA ligase family protein [Planococcus sp. CPCC 101016]